MATFSVWLGLLLLFAIMSPTWCDGYYQLRLITYENDDGVDDLGRRCDPSSQCDFYIKLVCGHKEWDPATIRNWRRTRTLPVLTRSRTPIIWFKTKSKTFYNQNSITFGNEFNSNLANPFRRPFKSWAWSYGMLFRIYEKDDDGRVHVDDMQWLESAKATGQEKIITTYGFYNGNKSRITFGFTAACNPNYYTRSCLVYCNAAENSTYTCNSDGSKACKPNYYTDNCNVYCNAAENSTYICNRDGSKSCFFGWTNPQNGCRDTMEPLSRSICNDDLSKISGDVVTANGTEEAEIPTPRATATVPTPREGP